MKVHDYTGQTCGNYKVIKQLPKTDKGRNKYLCKNVITGEEKVLNSMFLYSVIRKKVLQYQRKLAKEQAKKDKIK